MNIYFQLLVEKIPQYFQIILLMFISGLLLSCDHYRIGWHNSNNVKYKTSKVYLFTYPYPI